jgi:hypothetical protein
MGLDFFYVHLQGCPPFSVYAVAMTLSRIVVDIILLTEYSQSQSLVERRKYGMDYDLATAVTAMDLYVIYLSDMIYCTMIPVLPIFTFNFDLQIATCCMPPPNHVSYS